ncbi:MFS transporter [Cupriavidus necator]|uniref:MFS transporter n=1 Tax=Cupriavidus necator TaxID=106590 RepID=A0A367P5Y7_CUPNE|nr:MFS transporter [Cupriavidus necator]QQX84663.1 MFS transporter [Cupriavidus necator]RCJ03238.1 MFS transporter [Cupriavidus necator]
MTMSYQPRRAWLTAALLFFFLVVNAMDKMVVGLLAAPMMDELGLTPAQFGLVGSSFFWLFAVSGVLGGFLANRMPTSRLLVCMALAWSLCQIPLALSSSLAVLIVSRILLGFMEGPAAPVAIHACYKWFPNSRRNLPVAVLTQGAGIGIVLAGFLIPAVAVHWGWRANFYVLAALGVLWAVAWLALGREGTLDERPAGHDAPHAPAAASAPLRLPYRLLLSDPTVLGCFALRLAAYWGLALCLTWIPAYLQSALGFGHAVSGKLFALIIGTNLPLTLAIAWFSERLLARGVSSRVARGRVSAGMLLLAGGFFLLLLWPDTTPAMRVGLLVVACVCAPAIYSLGPAMLAEVVPAGQRGAILAIDASVSSLAGVLAPLVTGVLVQNVPGARGFELGLAVCGAIMVVAALAGLYVVNPERSRRRLAAHLPSGVEAGQPAVAAG